MHSQTYNKKLTIFIIINNLADRYRCKHLIKYNDDYE